MLGARLKLEDSLGHLNDLSFQFHRCQKVHNFDRIFQPHFMSPLFGIAAIYLKHKTQLLCADHCPMISVFPKFGPLISENEAEVYRYHVPFVNWYPLLKENVAVVQSVPIAVVWLIKGASGQHQSLAGPKNLACGPLCKLSLGMISPRVPQVAVHR